SLTVTNVVELLEYLLFFSGRKTLLERSLLLTDALGSRGEPWRCHVQQNVGTIHPVDMRHHGLKAMMGDILKAQVLLDRFMKNLHGPTHPVPGHNLACGGPQIIAGKVLAATIRSVTLFGTHQLDLAHRAQVARGVSDAKVHSLAFVATRRQTNGVPLEPAMTTEKRVDVAPLSRWRGGEIERFRFDAARCAQATNEAPAFVATALLDFFVVVAAIGQHQHLTPIVSTDIILEVERAQVCHHALMLTLIHEIMCLAVALAIEGNRRQGNQYVTEHQDDIG